MNIKDTVMMSAVKAAMPFIPSLTPKLEEFVLESLRKKVLADGETRAIFSLLEGSDGEAYIVVAYLNAQDTIVRTEAPLKLSDFFADLLKKV